MRIEKINHLTLTRGGCHFLAAYASGGIVVRAFSNMALALFAPPSRAASSLSSLSARLLR